MKNNLKLYFFDVDGTLLCSGGKKLQKGVPQLLESINSTGGQVVFISASNHAEIKKFLGLVYENSNLTKENFHPFIASNGGSYISEFNWCAPISKDLMSVIKTITHKVDPSAIYVYRTQNNTFIDSVLDTNSLKLMMNKAGKKLATEIVVGLRLYTLNAVVLRQTQIDALTENNQILSINILSLKSRDVARALSRCLNISISTSGPYVDLSVVDKLDVIKFFMIENGVTQENCAMFGDSCNDTAALLYCGFGALCNLKPSRLDLLQRVTALPNHYATDDLNNLIDAATNQEFDPILLERETELVRQSMKKPKEKTFVK